MAVIGGPAVTGYVSVEKLLVAWIPSMVTTGTSTLLRTVTDLPANLSGALPVVRVARVGGPRAHRIDSATVVIDCYAADRDSAEKLANQVCLQIEDNLPGYSTGDATVSATRTISGPSWAPYDDTNLRRYTASYRITVHSLH